MELSVDDTTFHVHRGVLAEHCRYFRQFFTDARAQEPTTVIRHMDCSYAPISFERGRPFSIIEIDSEDDSIFSFTAGPKARLHARRDRPIQDPEGDGRDALGSEDDEDGLYFADVEGSASTGRGHGHTGPARATSQQKHLHSTHLSRSRTDPSPSSPKLDPKVTLRPSTPISTSYSAPINEEPICSFSAAFVAADQRSVGYTSHNFACFLQILYGLLHPFHLHEVDLLAVFRISHIYGVPGLVNLLGDRIWDTLDLTTETWPCLVRFSKRFCLEDIKRRALRHASETRELWTVAVETLGLDDFKDFLRGIDQPEGVKACTGGQGQRSDLRGMKDELLMIFLLVHYQESSGSKDFGPSLHRDDGNISHSGAPLIRDLPKRFQRDSASIKIRQQLQQRTSTGLPSPNLPTRANSNAKNNNNAGNKTVTDTIEQASFAKSLALGHVLSSPSPPSSLRPMPAQPLTTKVDKAKTWMTRFKHDCGWGGQASLLD
ncbi:hypothetical protein BGZ96_007133 [Linnemannia gamsii]|uniref:BTB domain-containing protein n=1 Tax=Linnemannia gamsii TaxID=64522 RepID=A0ABQ7K350_9FUNG|nr:hypothetical protein BGZ96_007133 [Linnemannia gamsii]